MTIAAARRFMSIWNDASACTPNQIDAIVFTGLHWDHMQTMKQFLNARDIALRAEIEMACNPLPLSDRIHSSAFPGVEPPPIGYVFEAVNGETDVLPGITLFHTPGRSVGHMSATVTTSACHIVVAGDAILRECNLEPNPDESWRCWVPALLVDS